MNTKNAIKNSIGQWEDMISWVEKLPPEEKVQKSKMPISNNWYGKYCPLCQIHHGCYKCLVAERYGDCNTDDNGNHWKATAFSETWGEWLDNARIFLNQLRELEK